MSASGKSHKDLKAMEYLMKLFDDEVKQFEKRIDNFSQMEIAWHNRRELDKMVRQEATRVFEVFDTVIADLQTKLLCDLFRLADDTIAGKRSQAIAHFKYVQILGDSSAKSATNDNQSEFLEEEAALVRYGMQKQDVAKNDRLFENMMLGETRSKSHRIVSRNFRLMASICNKQIDILDATMKTDSLSDLILAQRHFGKWKKIPLEYIKIDDFAWGDLSRLQVPISVAQLTALFSSSEDNSDLTKKLTAVSEQVLQCSYKFEGSQTLKTIPELRIDGDRHTPRIRGLALADDAVYMADFQNCCIKVIRKRNTQFTSSDFGSAELVHRFENPEVKITGLALLDNALVTTNGCNQLIVLSRSSRQVVQSIFYPSRITEPTYAFILNVSRDGNNVLYVLMAWHTAAYKFEYRSAAREFAYPRMFSLGCKVIDASYSKRLDCISYVDDGGVVRIATTDFVTVQKFSRQHDPIRWCVNSDFGLLLTQERETDLHAYTVTGQHVCRLGHGSTPLYGQWLTRTTEDRDLPEMLKFVFIETYALSHDNLDLWSIDVAVWKRVNDSSSPAVSQSCTENCVKSSLCTFSGSEADSTEVAWHIVEVQQDNTDESGPPSSDYDVRSFGRILASGWGLHPPVESWRKVHKERRAFHSIAYRSEASYTKRTTDNAFGATAADSDHDRQSDSNYVQAIEQMPTSDADSPPNVSPLTTEHDAVTTGFSGDTQSADQDSSTSPITTSVAEAVQDRNEQSYALMQQSTDRIPQHFGNQPITRVSDAGDSDPSRDAHGPNSSELDDDLALAIRLNEEAQQALDMKKMELDYDQFASDSILEAVLEKSKAEALEQELLRAAVASSETATENEKQSPLAPSQSPSQEQLQLPSPSQPTLLGVFIRSGKKGKIHLSNSK